jgi:hypothetical protein
MFFFKLWPVIFKCLKNKEKSGLTTSHTSFLACVAKSLISLNKLSPIAAPFGVPLTGGRGTTRTKGADRIWAGPKTGFGKAVSHA